MYHEPTNELRFVNRIEPFEENLNLGKTIKVLQQKWLDGHGNPYWKDVPLVEEDKI